jgi:hypothetical protein
MAHDEEVLSWLRETASPLLMQWVAAERLESIQRLNGIQALVDEFLGVLEEALFDAVFERLRERAEEVAGRCPVCGLGCERERKTVRVRTTRRTLDVEVCRYRCRACRTNRCPVREWLGLESGATTAGLDRALTALSTQMSFGAAAQQMAEQHGHEVDRTLVERRTYAVGQDAVDYLEERDTQRLQEVMDAVGVRAGTEQVLVQVDSGAVPVGELVRPRRNPMDKNQELTPVRRLPKGRRPKTKREVRVVVAWQPGQVDDKVVNLHVAPLKHPEVTGESMYIAALEADMGDNTHVHCTCDMAQWQALQFDEQFGAQPRATLCADFYHTLEYVAAAGKALQPEADKLKSWIAMQARRLKEGDREAILVDLREHRCASRACPKTDKDECVVTAANRYLTRNGKHMDYPRFIAEGLPIGSGEVEGRIRHIVRRRLDVPGDWREKNLVLLTALLTIRHSGRWDDFWSWQDLRDKKRFQRRLLGEGLNRFRGPREPRLVTHSTERLELDGLSPMFEGGAQA